MIEKFIILTKGGVVLFEWLNFGCDLSNSTVDKLISQVLIEEKVGITSFTDGMYEAKWRLNNNIDIIFIVFTQKEWKVSYLDDLLDLIQQKFSTLFTENGKSPIVDYNKLFMENFKNYLKKVENKKVETKMTTFEESNKSKKTLKAMSEMKKEEKNKEDKKEIAKSPSKKPVKKGAVKKEVKKKDVPKLNSSWKKEDRSWDNKGAKGEEAKKLDFGDQRKDENVELSEKDLEFDLELPPNDEHLNEVSDDEDEEEITDNKPKKRGFFANLFSPLTGKTLEEEDLDPVIKKLKDHIIQKNVASQIAEQLCGSVLESLKGKHLGSFKSVTSVVNDSLRDSLTKILTPKKQINILRDVKDCQSKGIPYTMVFCGINGVGKSTTLAKVCAWLKQQKLRVMIVACDTFRSGAIEQLRTHAERLGVPLFQQGYGGDPSNIARMAISAATEKENKADVVLIDTAGRMQGNIEQMAALAKLVHVNNPNLVVFVGSALDGNDSVDQLTKFNQALIDHSPSSTPRTLDGVILTKFDTIDEKVGTTISLVYSSGLPIIFLGVGQHYNSLKQMNTQSVINALLK